MIAEQQADATFRNFSLWVEWHCTESTNPQRSKLFESGKPIILATGGSLVLDVQNWSRLRGYSRTVWLRCAPEVYLERVREQGDWRPMQGYSDALEEVKSILQEREKLYAQADMIVDTDANTIAESVGQLKEFFKSNL